MARALHRLSAAALRRNKVGLYADGGNLYLQVTEAEGGGFNRSWLFRFKVGGKDRWMGGGSTHTVSLAEAREWAREQRKLRLAASIRSPTATRCAPKRRKPRPAPSASRPAPPNA